MIVIAVVAVGAYLLLHHGGSAKPGNTAAPGGTHTTHAPTAKPKKSAHATSKPTSKTKGGAAAAAALRAVHAGHRGRLPAGHRPALPGDGHRDRAGPSPTR